MARAIKLQAAIDNLVSVVMELREADKGDDTGKPLGELVRHHRDAWGLSLQALADRTGMAKAHLWEIEHGDSANPRVETIGKLAEALVVPPIHLLNAALLSQRLFAANFGLQSKRKPAQRGTARHPKTTAQPSLQGED